MSAAKEVEASSGAGETDQSIEHIICFAQVIELYHKKNRNCSGCSSPDHLIHNCPKDLSQSAQKSDLNTKRGQQRREARPLKN